jgi:hypothetical protein
MDSIYLRETVKQKYFFLIVVEVEYLNAAL